MSLASSRHRNFEAITCPCNHASLFETYSSDAAEHVPAAGNQLIRWWSETQRVTKSLIRVPLIPINITIFAFPPLSTQKPIFHL